MKAEAGRHVPASVNCQALSAGGADGSGGATSLPFRDERLRHHQTPAPISTAPARMPKAIHPHCVLSSVGSLLFAATAAPAAAAAAGLTAVVVAVVAVVETTGCCSTVSVCV